MMSEKRSTAWFDPAGYDAIGESLSTADHSTGALRRLSPHRHTRLELIR
jgi:hypothetical protein